MKLLKNILQSGQVIEAGTNLIDTIVTNKEERENLKANMVKILQDYNQAIQQEVTKRHEADMQSDSWLSKNIRPMVLIFILFIYSAFSVLDGNIGNFIINSNYIELLGQWGMLIMSFYFGSRGVEKIFSIINNKNKKS